MGRRGGLRFFTQTGLLQDYMFREQLMDQGGFPERTGNTAGGDNNPGPNAGWSPASPYGVRAQEVPLFPEYEVGGDTASDVWLVDPQNLIWGVKREIVVYRQFVPRKDTIEYTMFTRVGCAIENPNAAVLVKNVGYRA
jgi:hypothetical protein